MNHVVPGLPDRLGSLGRRAKAARGVFHVAAARDEKQAKAYLLMLKVAEQGATGSDHPGEGNHDQRMNRQFERMALQCRKAVFRSSGALAEEAVMIGREMHSAPRWRGPWR